MVYYYLLLSLIGLIMVWVGGYVAGLIVTLTYYLLLSLVGLIMVWVLIQE